MPASFGEAFDQQVGLPLAAPIAAREIDMRNARVPLSHGISCRKVGRVA
jgi:hypothetical protein